MKTTLQEPDHLSHDLDRRNSRAFGRTEYVDTKSKEVVGSSNQPKQ